MDRSPQVISGGIHKDDRGAVLFINDFDLSEVKRMYHITHKDDKTVRAWQGHKRESKWFYCSKGSFEIYLIYPDNWISPSLNLKAEKYILESSKPSALHIPGGYINGFRALESLSLLLVFSDFYLTESQEDDFRFPSNYWPYFNEQ